MLPRVGLYTQQHKSNDTGAQVKLRENGNPLSGSGCLNRCDEYSTCVTGFLMSIAGTTTPLLVKMSRGSLSVYVPVRLVSTSESCLIVRFGLKGCSPIGNILNILGGISMLSKTFTSLPEKHL